MSRPIYANRHFGLYADPSVIDAIGAVATAEGKSRARFINDLMVAELTRRDPGSTWAGPQRRGPRNKNRRQ